MALTIKRTGLAEYGPSGDGILKVLLIGGPGVGKTRFSSYWPNPIYLDCEGGLSSVADRQVPYVSIKSSRDMLNALVELKKESAKPINERVFNTVVVDTLDAFQRKVKDEWLLLNPNEKAFTGYDAWNYLDAKMQMLLTRLLNLEMNVIVCVHYREKNVTEGTGANATDRLTYELQLQGAVKDLVYNDFDLVGWMGKFFATVDGQRVEKRGLTFTPTEQKPFLKDRLNATPKWLEINFSYDDYSNLFMSVIEKLDDLPESAVVGEIPDADEGDREPTGFASSNVVAPGDVGALPPVDPKDIPLQQYDKPTLAKIADKEGVKFTVQGAPIKNNTLKSEIIAAIEAKRAGTSTEPAPEPAARPEPVQQTDVSSDGLKPGEQVDPATGEITQDEAIENVLTQMPGSKVVADEPVVQPEPAAKPASQPVARDVPVPDDKHCEKCGTEISPDNMQTNIAWIKFRMRLCPDDFLAEKAERANK